MVEIARYCTDAGGVNLLANEDEIEQHEVGEAGCAEEPVADCSWPPDPQEDGQKHGMG
jgi:hypothetical protein